jgi:hypothetical protein
VLVWWQSVCKSCSFCLHSTGQLSILMRLASIGGQMADRREGGHTEQLKPAELICVSAASKMVASTATYPHEVIRSYMHIQGTGAFRGLASTCNKVSVCGVKCVILLRAVCGALAASQAAVS